MFAEFKVKERENMDETRDDAKIDSLHTSHPVGWFCFHPYPNNHNYPVNKEANPKVTPADDGKNAQRKGSSN